ncbi:MAG: hypothetical protein Wins2KO_10840 [Winogradskyella sp.]|uniref:hypothetical protein n=1 Tax=Winogradskyella sp. TaxID=1883156 RepID=UPI0025D4A2A9|nr:hypothetical protein [Winogradskyella sp.]NRB60520.1 hypothetical protein [Winogradskyella sp.]
MFKKKIKILRYSFTFLVLFGCQNEPYEGEIVTEDNSCIIATNATNIASNNFFNSTEEEYSLFCQVYRDALADQIEICGDEDGSLTLLLNNLGNCEIDDPCDEIETQTNLARIAFESAIASSYEVLCNAYKDALVFQIEECGDDGSLQIIIDELGECEPENQIEIAGNWKLVSWNTDELRDLNNDGIVTNNYLDDIDCFDNETIIFNLDNTGTMFLRSEAVFSFTPTMDGEDFFTVCTDINVDKDFTWVETINSVILSFTDGTSLSLFKNSNLYTAIDDAFYAESTIDDAVITERITFVYVKQ